MRRLFLYKDDAVELGNCVYFGAGAIPYYGWFAIAGGIIFSLIVGCGLMALMFYSARHGYDELNEKDRQNDQT